MEDLAKVLFDILIEVLHSSIMGAPLERVNVNLPPETRVRLRRLAKALKLTEGEVARELMLKALDQAERAELERRIAKSRTTEARAREQLIARSLEKLNG